MKHIYLAVSQVLDGLHCAFVLPIPTGMNLRNVFEQYPNATIMHLCESKKQAEDTIACWNKISKVNDVVKKAEECLRDNDVTEVSECRREILQIFGTKADITFEAPATVTPEQKERAENVLKRYGVQEDEADTVLQALGYILFDKEFYKEASA